MLVLFSIFALFGLKIGSAGDVSLKLNLSSELCENFIKNYLEFDNVSYLLYKPLNDGDIDQVLDGNEVVWSGSETYDRAKAVVVAFDNSSPTLLYVYTPIYSFHKFYYVRVDGKWVKSSYDWYYYRLELVKVKMNEEFILDLGFARSTNKFLYDPSGPSKGYDTFIPFNGYSATSVNYNQSSLWTSKVPGERVVVAWTYKHYSTHYLVRLLVCDQYSKFRFTNYIRLRNHWVDMDDTPLSIKPAYRYPDDIYFPQYLALKAQRQSFLLDPRAPGSSIRTNTIASAHDHSYHNKPIPVDKCLKLDFSKKVPSVIGEKVQSLFGHSLHVESYFPVYGNFFGRVTDGKDTIYQRNIDIEACVGVHFYTRGDKMYLADVLVTSPRHPRSEYHVKQDGRWSPINKGRFFELMDELRK